MFLLVQSNFTSKNCACDLSKRSEAGWMQVDSGFLATPIRLLPWWLHSLTKTEVRHTAVKQSVTNSLQHGSIRY